MLHVQSPEVRRRLFEGRIGLEVEGWRILADGSLAPTPHPLRDDAHIVTDYAEGLTEIITSPESTARDAMRALSAYRQRLHETLLRLPTREYVWLFSNPPRLPADDDIPAAWSLVSPEKNAYYRRLVGRYGHRRLSLAGVHVNLSFADALLEEEYSLQRLAGSADMGFRAFRDGFYLQLAEKASAYAWLPVALTAASPVVDGSYLEEGGAGDASLRHGGGRDVFTGMGSVRCSHLGLWNSFLPVMDYTSVERYAARIQGYVDAGLLGALSELYLPVRVKPVGQNSLEALTSDGVSHIELRMFDLNPLADDGIDVRDVQFAQLLLIWLASLPLCRMSADDQMTAMRDFWSAACYDLSSASIEMPGQASGAMPSVEDAARATLGAMRAFYDRLEGACRLDRGARMGVMPEWVGEVLTFEEEKITCPEVRYAHRVRERFSDTFLGKGVRHAMRSL